MVRASPSVRSASFLFVLLILLSLASSNTLAGTPRWIQIGPPSVVGGAVLYDSARDRHLVGDPNGELWAVSNDPVPVWTDLGVDGFEQGAAVYDAANDRIVRITQARQNGDPVPSYEPHKVFQLELGNSPLRWQELPMSGVFVPPLRGYASVYDPLRQRMLFFGGVRDTVGHDDDQVYALSLTGSPTWSRFTAMGPTPPPRSLTQAAYDPWRDRMIVFGGRQFTGMPEVYVDLGDTWALTLGGAPTWTQLETPNGAPPPRHAYAMALDAESRRMIVTTGRTFAYPWSVYGDAWSLDLSASVPANQAQWTEVANMGYRPTPREGAIAWIDGSHDRLMLHGGFTGISEQRTYHTAAWTLPLAAPLWTPVGVDTFPAPLLVGHVSAFLRSGPSGQFLAGFGSLNGYEQTGDLWITPADGMAGWQRWRGLGPGVRNDAGLVVDPQSGRMVVFGGERRITYGVQPQFLGDVWELRFPNWSSPSAGIQPPGRSQALMVMDPERSRFIMYGGRYGWGAQGRDDTWSYDLMTSSWSQLPIAGFGQRWQIAGIHDPVANRILAFGGTDVARSHSDVFELSLDDPTGWTPVVTNGTPPPPSNYDCAAVYDPFQHRMLVFMFTWEGYGMHVWSLSLSGTPTWSRLSPEGGQPHVGNVTSVAMDHQNGRVLLYAGAQLWALDLGQGRAIPAWLASVHGETDQIRIVWQAADPAVQLEVRRSHADGAWESLGTLQTDIYGRLVLEDRDVAAGERYRYQLVIPGSDGTVHFGDVAVYAGPPPAPTARAFRLDGARPNPSLGPVTIAFALETGEPATLELIDLTGRRVMAVPVGDQGPGPQVVTLDSERRLPGGLYFARLAQGGQVRTRRVVVVR